MESQRKGTMSTASLSMGERISYGAGSLGNFFIMAIVSGFLLYFYTDQIGLNAGAIGTIMLLSRVFDGVSDLIMGAIVDKTRSKYGKARSWILRLCIPYAICGVLMFTLQSSWPSVVQYVYVFISYNLVNTVCYTGVCVPYNAMNALLTKDQYERGLLGTANVIGAVVAQIIVNTFTLKLVAAFGNTQTAWIVTIVIFGVLGVVAHLICFKGTTERTETGEMENPGFMESFKSLVHNKYWLILAGIGILNFFVNGILGAGTVYVAKIVFHNDQFVASITNALNIAQLITFLCAFVFIKKLGKGNSYKTGLVIQVVASVLRIIFIKNSTLFLVFGFIQGIGVGMGSACYAGMISDSIEYGEWKTGTRCVGMANAANTFSQKVGSGLGSALVGWILTASGYVGTASVQTASVTTGVMIMYFYIPLVCMILNCVLGYFYKLDREYPQIIAELEERHNK